MSAYQTIDPTLLRNFNDGRPIKQIILICDVDGVIRNSTEMEADSQVVESIKALVNTSQVDAAFISGTPVVQYPSSDIWRKGNIALDYAVGRFFIPEMNDNKVTLFGALGGQRMSQKCQVEFVDEYPLEILFELGKLLLHAFLNEVIHEGTSLQKNIARDFKGDIEALKLLNEHQSTATTPYEFSDLVLEIRSQLDPHFRLVCNSVFIETQTSNPPWTTTRSTIWLKSTLENPHLLISHYAEEQKQIATGLAHREGGGFNFLMISKTNKGLTIGKHIQDKRFFYPDALVVTVGDTQIDFPMHRLANLAFHVGQEHVWKTHALPQCVLVRDKSGKDCQHVAGTLQVLNILKDGIGKPLSNWNFALVGVNQGSKFK